MSLLPKLTGPALEAWARGAASVGSAPAAKVREIMDAVRTEGDAALLRLAEEFDGRPPRVLRVPPSRWRQALAGLSSSRREALSFARDNITRVHEAQRRIEPPVRVLAGVEVWREFRPIRRVGLYVPGGTAAYPSSLLMGAIPARIAGCRQIVACSPAGPSGEPSEAVLAAAALVGVDELYAVGGAHAIAAMAYGTETIERVDKIFGPGGRWVNAAKLAAFSVVAIDLPAGPSEVLIWADASGDPGRIAAELVAQAEHGLDSRCALVLSDAGTASLARLADAVRRAAGCELARLPDERRLAAEASLAAGAVYVAPDDQRAARWIDSVAAEHLAIHGANVDGRLALVSSAGAVFLGETSSVAGGDYCTGSNHVLPTGGRARGAGGLDVEAFGRWMTVQRLSAAGARRVAPTAATLAEWEGLPGHARSVRLAAETAAATATRTEARS